jgi:hypothetical protein
LRREIESRSIEFASFLSLLKRREIGSVHARATALPSPAAMPFDGGL